ncbi:MAG: ATP-binding protein, partial [Hyphomicrobiales bacterium]|nr:ATP-binding protein [Hyphomicrobiales bacterium]
MNAPYDTTPKPAFLRALQQQKWTVHGALSELIDNSYGPGRGDASTVLIIHDTTNRVLEVVDDGRGMQAVGMLFQLGDTIGRSVGDIGHYGSGGTMAILWFPSVVDVWTLRDGLVSHHQRAWAQQFGATSFFPVPNEWEPSTPSNTPDELREFSHGTMIRLHLLTGRSVHSGHVTRELSQIYGPGLRRGKRLLWQTITNGRSSDIAALSDPFQSPESAKDHITFEASIRVGVQSLPVRGCVALIDGRTYKQSQIAVGYGYRIIERTNDCYQSPDGSEKYHGIGVGGWVDLGEGWQSHLSTTKDVIINSDARDALMGLIFSKIKPLLEQTESAEIRILFEDIALNFRAGLGALRMDSSL